MRKLPGLKFYSINELIKRLFWINIGNVLIKLTPRHFYILRNLILKFFGASIGSNVKVFPSIRITHPWLLHIGSNSVISWNVNIYNLANLKIGNNSIISQNVHLCGGTHDYKSPGFELQRCEITIGNNVWIAADAFIGPNVTIGDNSIIGARAVCLKDVPANSIMSGNPAVKIKDFIKPQQAPNTVS